MTVRCGQILVVSLFLLVGCADTPPAVIENKSVVAVDVPPEVRQTNTTRPDYGPQLAAGPDYVVEPGDTLYAVAFRLGMDYRTLASLNDIDPPYVIRVGQALQTVPNAALGSAASALETHAAQVGDTQRASGTSVKSAAGDETARATEAESITATAKPAATKSEPGPPSHTLSLSLIHI